MLPNKILEKIDVSKEKWQESIDKHDVFHEKYEGVSYYRLTKKVGRLGKGAIVTHDGILYEFPRIARILHLENGIRNAYTQPFYIEEKVDGYNVRVACIQGKVLVFSRGAFVCPFSTDRIADFLDIRNIFRERPELVICGEFAGPDNPYNIEHPPYVKEDIRFFAFDIRLKGQSQNLPMEERQRLYEAYSIPTVRRFGRFTPSDITEIKKIIEELNAGGSEGIVIKPAKTEGKTLKYVTLGSCLRDIKVTAPLMAEMTSEYYTHRIIRAAMYLHEQSNSLREENFRQLGEAMLKPIYESVTKTARNELIKEPFLLRFREEKNIDLMIDHMRKCRVKFEVLSKERIGSYWHVTFARKCYASFEILQKHLGGAAHVD